MDTSYDELKTIMDYQYFIREQSGHATPDFHDLIVNLLDSYGIKLRQRDGSNPIATVSIPTSRRQSFVVGLRYTKLDGTKTEDHFLFEFGNPIRRCYGKKLERLLPEYRGAHKLQR